MIEADSMKKLLSFCKKYSKVVCYGAGIYGEKVQLFLKYNSIVVDAFMVSKLKSKLHLKKNGVQIYEVDENLFKDAGIILSLHSRNHKDVIDLLKKKNFNMSNIYPLHIKEISFLRDNELNLRRSDVLLKPSRFDFNKEYEKKITFIKNNYKCIKIGYIDVHNIGGLMLWLYYYYQWEKKKGLVYKLYYPITGNESLDEEFLSPNNYLLGKLLRNGLEVISPNNIDFWRYYFQRCGLDNVKFLNSFQLWGWEAGLSVFLKNIHYEKKYVFFNEEEEKKGIKILNKIGLQKNGYVCMSARDRAYYVKTLKREKTELVMETYRNSSISTRNKAVKYLIGKGLPSVRMGAVVNGVAEGDGWIDYANLFRTEFMDVYLSAYCRYFVSDLGGVQTFPTMFSKPMVILNVALLTTRCDNIPIFSPYKDIAILKKFWDTKNRRYLTIREMLDIEVNGFRYDENITMNTFRLYSERGIIPIDNTEEEIFDVIKEMDECISKTKKYTEEEMNLQNRYRKLVDEYPKKENILSQWRLGTEFLKQNQWLLA